MSENRLEGKEDEGSISRVRLCELMHYCQETGVFVWRVNKGRAIAGNKAGTSHGDGYLTITIDRTCFYAHRLAWFYSTGRWPTDEIDHINGVRGDNRIDNLRECTRAENMQNRRPKLDSTSGHVGVSWHKRDKKWQAGIMLNGVQKYLGTFDSIESAIEARRMAKHSMHSFQPEARAQ